LIAQSSDSGDIGNAIFGRKTSCSHHRNNPGNVLGARSTLTLLASAELASSKRDTGTNNKRAHALWSPEFVRTQTERIDNRTRFSDICPTKRLHRIRMKHRIRRRSAHDFCKRC
jgi:hypothetical protein